MNNSGEYYASQIKSKKYDPLTSEQEIALAKRIHKDPNDREARDRLVCGSLRFAVWVASGYRGSGLSMEDLVQEANKALFEAAERFDYTKNLKFDSYAVWWIRRRIITAINRLSRIVRVPQSSSAMSVSIKRATSKLTQKYHRCPTSYEIAREVKIKERWIGILENTNNAISLNETKDDMEMIDLITYKHKETNIDKKAIRLMLERLPERERDFIVRYYLSEHTSKLEDIAKTEGISRERVRQVIYDGMRKLKKTTKKSEVYA